MNPIAKLSDLVDSLEFQYDEHHVYFDRQTAQIVVVEKSILSAVEEGEDDDLSDVPEWQKHEVETARAVVADRGGRFIDPPDKFEFHEYRHMEAFIDTIHNGPIAQQLACAIRGRGAFRYFKDALAQHDLLDDWYLYRTEAMKLFAIEWAEDNNVPYQDDLKERAKAIRKNAERQKK